MSNLFRDERIEQEARRQNSRGFALLYYGLLMDLLYRQFLLHEPLARLWDLGLVFFGVTFYMAGQRVLSGIFLNKPRPKFSNKYILLPALIAACTYTAVNRWLLGNKSPAELTLQFVLFFIAFSGVMLIMQYIARKKNDDLLKDD